MIFGETRLKDVVTVDIEPREDQRGFFARTWCRDEFARHGLDVDTAQNSVSINRRKGTLRGLHFQRAPHAETKLVRCVRGAIWDVVVDLRPDSPTFGKWQGFELTAANYRALSVPKGFAHGFQTLADDTEVFYQISTFYAPEAAAGYRYDDPAFAIEWPLPVAAISPKDLEWPRFDPTNP